MKINIKKLLIAMGVIMVLLPTTWYSLQFYWQSKTKNLYEEAQNNYNKKYAYINFSQTLDQTLYAENEQEAEKLLQYYSKLADYYSKVETGEIERKKEYNIITGDSGYVSPFSIPIPLKYIGVETPIYIKDMNTSSSIYKVFVFNTKCWGYIEAYIPKSVVHDAPPQDSLLQKIKLHINNLPKQDDDIYGKPSSYGFYCN